MLDKLLLLLIAQTALCLRLRMKMASTSTDLKFQILQLGAALDRSDLFVIIVYNQQNNYAL